MAPTGHEVVISVVENPRKPSTGPSEEINTGSVVLGKKRPQSLLSDITTADKGQSAMLMNGPFVASEMLRNVAKRQRRNSEGSSLVNGSSEQKGPMAWDELVRAEAKPPVMSPKLPIAVNGVRFNILPEPARDYGSKVEPITNPEKKPTIKTTNPLGSLANTALVNHGNMTNTSLGNQGNIANATGVAKVANASLGNHISTTNTTANETGSKSPRVPNTNVETGTLPPVTSQMQTSGGNAVTESGDTATVGVTTPKDQTPDNKPRGEQAAGVVLPYRCLWSSCNW